MKITGFGTSVEKCDNSICFYEFPIGFLQYALKDFKKFSFVILILKVYNENIKVSSGEELVKLYYIHALEIQFENT